MLNIKIIETSQELETCFNIRNKVFIEEQSVPIELEKDDLDDIAVHFLAYSDKVPVGTGRLVRINNNAAKIGRVAVLKEYRGKNIGKLIIQEIIDYAKNSDISILLLAAQSYVTGFYEQLGFRPYGKEFLDANIPHYMMRLELQ